MEYRNLYREEIDRLIAGACSAEDWNSVLVSEGFNPEYVRNCRFFGEIRLGKFEKVFNLPGGMKKHSGLYMATLHNVSVGDDCCIENVNNYISNYDIGQDTYIENVDVILTDCVSSFGNGVEVNVMNETGGREVMIYDRLSSQQAYMMALYRHRPVLISKMKEIIRKYSESVSSDRGSIGSNVIITDTGYLKNVKVGDFCKIEGASRLKNGSINSNGTAPVHIGVNVIGDDFIICSGSSVEDASTFSRCFIGQNCKFGHNYSASDSLFFSNCQEENGEACAIFAGPFTVTHHKSTLLIASMFSFMNAGSGSNQSNHMYKLGPIHQGILERGAKTTSDSYILWPSKVGAFSLVMGRHVSHLDTSDLPFSYLIENHSMTYIAPGANLKSVGTIRDARKWPKRDVRIDPDRLDCINYNLLSPFTIQKMINGIEILKELKDSSEPKDGDYEFQGGRIKTSALEKGIELYRMAITKFMGNSVISRLQKIKIEDRDSLKQNFKPECKTGKGDWVDLAGLIAPKSEITKLVKNIESGNISDCQEINNCFHEMHRNYYDFEWTWAYDLIEKYSAANNVEISLDSMKEFISQWKDSVVTLDNLILDDASKEFSLTMMTSYGTDGNQKQMVEDFKRVRGALFENDPFVKEIKNHIKVKSDLAESVLSALNSL